MKTHFTSELFCHESYEVHINNVFSLGQWELATCLVAMEISLQWQPKRYLYKSFMLSPVEFLLSIFMFLDKKNQLHKALLW